MKSKQKEIYCSGCRVQGVFNCKTREHTDPADEYHLCLGRLYDVYKCQRGSITTVCKKCGVKATSLIAHHIICYVRDSGLPKQANIEYWGTIDFSGMNQDDYSITFGWSGIELYNGTEAIRKLSNAVARIDYNATFRIFPQLLFLNVDYFDLLKKLQYTTNHHSANVEDIADILLETTPQCLFTGKYYDSFPPKHVFLQSFTGLDEKQ